MLALLINCSQDEPTTNECSFTPKSIQLALMDAHLATFYLLSCQQREEGEGNNFLTHTLSLLGKSHKHTENGQD
jgi:hypothetical protein